MCVRFLQRAWGDKQDLASRDDEQKDERNQAKSQQVQSAETQKEQEPEQVLGREEEIAVVRASKKRLLARSEHAPAVDAGQHVAPAALWPLPAMLPSTADCTLPYAERAWD